MKTKGFTLLEVLIALFIFTILSMILMRGLRSVIDVQSTTEQHAERLRQMQFVLLIMSRDIEQIVNRSVSDATGAEEAVFIGSARSFTFTHMGFANPLGAITRSTLQRTRYDWHEGALWRATWSALDRAPQSQLNQRRMLAGIMTVHFQYLDKDNHFHDDWPYQTDAKLALPRAIRINLTISHWGNLSQLYVIPGQPSKTLSPST